MSIDELAFMTAADLVPAYRSGRLSPVEAARAALHAIDERNQELRAFCLVDAEGAIAQAEASEVRWRSGQPLGPLDGVPASVKDLYLTAGWPTLRGSRRVDPDQQWTVDSPVAERLRAGGVVMLGKTTTAEFGWKAVTDNPVDGVTRNPRDPARTAGGSSGGSGAALASGMGVISVGTDAAGSARIPAAFCGIAGFKPSYGRIPIYPASDLGSLGCAGPMARCTADIALLLDLLAGPDDRDPNSLPAPEGPFRTAMRRDVRGLRAAFSRDLGYAEVDPEVARVAESAVAALARAGLVVEEADPPFGDPLDDFALLWSASLARLLDTQLGGSADGIDPGLRSLIESGTGCTAARYLAARRAVLDLGIAMGEFHRRYDVLLTPTVPVEPFEAGHDVPPGGRARTWPEWTPFTFPVNMSQQPALSVPVGLTSRGLPVGLQIVGPRLADATVLAVGAAAETALTRA